MKCQDSKCIEEFKELTKEMGENDDDDFKYFHCEALNCHDISLGKTSFPCTICNIWLCQSHAQSMEHDIFWGGDNTYCIDCKNHKIQKKITKLDKKLSEIQTLQKNEYEKIEFYLPPLQCLCKKKRKAAIHCEAVNCHLEALECEKCKKNVCEDHSVYYEDKDQIICKNCIYSYLNAELQSTQTIKDKLFVQ